MILKSNKGFSLIEIVVSISLLSILLLAIPNLMLNVEKIKTEYKYNMSIDRKAKEIIDNAISSEVTENKDILLEDNLKYSVDVEEYNENINKYIFTFEKKSYIKKYYLLKEK